MCISTPKVGTQAVAPAPGEQPDGGDTTIRTQQQQQAALRNGPAGTLLTGGMGLTTAPQTANKTLLGS